MLTVLPHVAYPNIWEAFFFLSNRLKAAAAQSSPADCIGQMLPMLLYISWQFKMQKGVPHLDSDNVAQQTPPCCLLDLSPSSILPPL